MINLANITPHLAVLLAILFIFAMHSGQRHHQQQKHDTELHAAIKHVMLYNNVISARDGITI